MARTDTAPTTETLWGNANWRLLWGGQTASVLGDLVFDVTAVLWIASFFAVGDPNLPLATGAAFFCVGLPAVLLGPAAGVFVDRWPKIRTMQTANIIQAVSIASLLVLSFIQNQLPTPVVLGWIYTALLVTNAASQFFIPAKTVIVAGAVPSALRTAAVSATLVTANVLGLVAPSLAAPLMYTIGVQFALIVNTVSFVISLLFLSRVRVVEPERSVPDPKDSFLQSFWNEFRQGLVFIKSSRYVSTLVVILLVVGCMDGAFNGLLIPFMDDSLGLERRWLGPIESLAAGSALVGAAAAGLLAKKFRPVALIGPCTLIGGLFFLAFAGGWHWAIVLGFLALGTAVFSVLTVFVGPILMDSTPRNLLGRVVAVLTPMSAVAGIASALASGAIVSHVIPDAQLTTSVSQLGPVNIVLLVTAVGVVAVGVFAWARLRTAEPTE